VAGHGVWSHSWRVVSPSGALRVDLPAPTRERRRLARAVRAVSPGTSVVLCAQGIDSRRRCRSFAREAGVVPEREYVALPSVRFPALLVENDAGPIRYAVACLVTSPPGTSPAAGMGVALLRWVGVRAPRLVGAAAPGRMVVGRRS
jgi:hypothetical protein